MTKEQNERLAEIDVVLDSPEEQSGPWWDMMRYLRTITKEQADWIKSMEGGFWAKECKELEAEVERLKLMNRQLHKMPQVHENQRLREVIRNGVAWIDNKWGFDWVQGREALEGKDV